MSATIQVHMYQATVEDGQWSAEPIELQQLLTTLNPINSPAIANYDGACAQAAVDYFGAGAKLIKVDPVSTVAGRVY